MCTEVEIKRPGLRSLYVDTVRDLARHLRVIVPGSHLDRSTKVNRMATHCLCPIDVEASAEKSGYDVIETGFMPEYVLQKRSAR